MDARLAAFLDMDWDARADLLRGMPKGKRKGYMQSVMRAAEIQAYMLETHEVEDLHEFVVWLVTGK